MRHDRIATTDENEDDRSSGSEGWHSGSEDWHSVSSSSSSSEDSMSPSTFPHGGLAPDIGLPNEDDNADMMMKLMKAQAAEVGKDLAERAAVVRSIVWLGQHVPRSVVATLVDQVSQSEDLQDDSYSSSYGESDADLDDYKVGRVEENLENPQSAVASDDYADPFPDEFANSEPSSDESVDSLAGGRTRPLHVETGSENSTVFYNNTTTKGVVVEVEGRKGLFFEERKRGSLNLGGRNGVNLMRLPYSTKHDSAILFVDISGFTKLSTNLDIESFSKTINSYFDLIVDEVALHGGDILKYAGDAIFAEWSTVATPCMHENHYIKLEDCVAAAAVCGARIVKKCSNYPVFLSSGRVVGDASHGEQVATLNIYCGIGVGEVAAVHVGDNENRREFLLVGDPVSQVVEASVVASLGQLVASPQSLELLLKTCVLSDKISCFDARKPSVIATNEETYFSCKRVGCNGETPHPVATLSEFITLRCDSLDTRKLKLLRRLISLYVHPVVVREEFSSCHHHPRIDRSAEFRFREEAELRGVYVMFIMPLLTAELTGDEESDQQMFVLLNNIMLVTTRELDRYKGQLRQFIVDDKGVVLIATFGLRGSTFPNMVSERALPATTAIHHALQTELDVENQIGGTFGDGYCGVVGGVRRHEYAVLGPSVNLSARLMTSPRNPGILVDNAVRLKAGDSFSFDSLPPVKAKGYKDPVPIFEPLTATEKRWGQTLKDFVGRRREIMELVNMAKEASVCPTSAKMVFLSASCGTGKSSFLVQSMARIRKMGKLNKKKIIITRNVSNDADYMIPFSMFRSIFKDLMKELVAADSRRHSSFVSATSFCEDDLDGSVSCESLTSAGSSHYETCMDRLSYLMSDLDAPPEFAELVSRHLLCVKCTSSEWASAGQAKKPGNLKSFVDFMARALLRCTCHADLVVMALDNVHLLDELSWKVVQRLFERSRKLLIVCASRPLNSYKLNIDESFWNDLHRVHHRRSNFVQMSLLPLDEDDMRKLISKKLCVNESDIEGQLCADLYSRSGGMPHFAAELLETIKVRDLVRRSESGSIGWRPGASTGQVPRFSFESVEELMLHRLDKLAPSVRKLLHLCAVLGPEFRFLEVVTIFQVWMKVPKAERLDHCKRTKATFDLAVGERILEEVYLGGCDEGMDDVIETELNDDEVEMRLLLAQTNVQYGFYHDMWRSVILKVMLDERKRDMHRIIAEGLEAQYKTEMEEGDDYYSMVKIFGHWKGCGDKLKAADLAVKIAEIYEELGMNEQSMSICDETLEIWQVDSDDDEESIGGFSAGVLKSIGHSDLEYIVQCHVIKGRCATNLLGLKESVLAYQNALSILHSTPASADLRDRSVVFPIFSGLFLMLKFGKIKQDRDCTYEQDLVSKFVFETEKHGDPVHFTRALAMQSHVNARLGRFEEAIEAHTRLARAYDADQHSAAISKAYGSDKSSHNFAVCALWNLHVGREKEALELCEFVLEELLPKMDLRNVHNSMLLIYPVMIILKDRGQASRMREIFNSCIVQLFYEYYGEGAFTPCLSLYEPLLVLLEICGTAPNVKNAGEKIDWVLDEDSGIFSEGFDVVMGNYGRTATSVMAEICLRLARVTVDVKTMARLVTRGLKFAKSAAEVTRGGDGRPRISIAYEANRVILSNLEGLALQNDVFTFENSRRSL